MPTKVNKKFLAIPQVRFPKGKISILTDSRIPIDGLAQTLNMTLEQDSILRPRPPFIPYGSAYTGTCIGHGTFVKTVAGKPQYWEISAQVVAGVTTFYVRKDGGSWSAIAGPYTLTYTTTGWITFTQGAEVDNTGAIDNRVYISDGIDTMSYYDVTGGTIVAYTSLSSPGAPTLTASGGLTGSNYNQYYRISANNAGGESAAGVSQHVGISTARDFWASGQTITVSWSAVSGADSYNVYTADISGQEVYLCTVSGLTFVDDGTLAVNPFKLAPNNNSSAGPTLNTLINLDNQLFGVGDPNNPSYLWYSGQGQHFGDFSFNPQGGGYIGIDYGGSTLPSAVFPFHDGKGNPTPSVLTYGAAGRGKLYHIQFTSTVVGTTTLVYPSVYEASAQDGCASPRGVAVYNNNAYYCTGAAFKTTGTKPNVVNILATDTISDQILPDVQSLDLSALSSYVSQEFQGKIYFALPVGGGGTNNQIWVLDLTRGGLWILPWELADGSSIQHMWLYEDNSGSSHFLILTSANLVLELDLRRLSEPTQDNGVAFTTFAESGALTFDAGGVAQVSSYFTYFKFLYPRGTININMNGLDETGTTVALGSTQVVEPTMNNPFIWGTMLFSNPDGSSVFSGDSGSFSGSQPGPIVIAAVPSISEPIEVDEIVSEQSWSIGTNQISCDYLLSSITHTAYSIPRRYAGQP
jgi:hypothetical protein